jgi:hypothetical protein
VQAVRSRICSKTGKFERYSQTKDGVGLMPSASGGVQDCLNQQRSHLARAVSA